ncbi:MAG TPA: hypothetical protein VEQ41_06740 [Solirubrobacterales bacterium]|nr:hypothetical protein [Solirubrobacterales bacterium]
MTLGYRRIETTLAACLVGLCLALPATAGAASSKYPPDPAARGFNGGLAGWTASASFAGTCAAPLLCPSATNTFQPSDGADGGGHIRSAYQGVAGVTAVGGTTTAVFASPPFTYSGAAGQQATAVALTMDRRANVDELLAVEGNKATYSVRLADLDAGGESIPLIEPATLAGASSWRGVTTTSVDPRDLIRGHDYRLLITSAYTTGTGVLVGGNADYDNVVLEATRDGAGAGKGKAGDGSDGDGLGSERLAALVRAAAPGTAVVAGRGKATRLLVRVKCPRKVGRACRIATQGLLRKRKPATVRRTVKVRKGKAKLVALKVKPKARRQVVKRKRLLVRHKVRAGRATAVVYKTRKLIRR